MRVLVCGSRTLTDSTAVEMVLDGLALKHGPLVVIHGNCRSGVDAIADAWARYLGVDAVRFSADWVRYGRAAGPIRNSDMLSEGKPDLVVGFKDKPESAGTDDMLNKARSLGSIPVYEVRVL